MIYIIHFDQPFHHARHYVGYCQEGGLTTRIDQHRSGTGSVLLRHLNEVGITWRVVNLIHGGDRVMERTIKRTNHVNRWCPFCRTTHGHSTYKVQRGKPGRPGQYVPIRTWSLWFPIISNLPQTHDSQRPS